MSDQSTPDPGGDPSAGVPGPSGAGDTDAGGPDAGDSAGGTTAGDDVIDIDDELAAVLAASSSEESGQSVAEEASEEADPVALATRQRDEYLDALRRLQADFENFKKRAARQLGEATARAGETLVDRMLPAFDTLDLAVAHGGGEELAQVRSAFLDALGRDGLERIAPDGGAFDPTRHDAVMHEAGDGDGGPEVAEVLRAGWAWKGRVLRPAMVKVRG